MNRLTCVASLILLVGGFAARADDSGWKPAKGPLATRWAAKVDPKHVHAEYPRSADGPAELGQSQRPLGICHSTQGRRPAGGVRRHDPRSLPGRIGPLGRDEARETRRARLVSPNVRAGRARKTRRWLLHFGAIDWDATVFVNGHKLVEHKGGYDPFSVDATGALVPGALQEVVVSVWDPTDRGSQPRGKQVLKPGGIMYTANTGIWQTVWLEPVPKTWINSLKIVPELDTALVRVWVDLGGTETNSTIEAVVLDDAREIVKETGTAASPLVIRVPGVKAWSPDSPFLYGLRVSIRGGDTVKSYFGMRKISVAKDESGINRLFLNGKALFQIGPLDQGWWPDGLYTAPTDLALKYDLDITKKLGFNMIRKHVKVEPERWYYWCDTLGILVWQDMPAGDNKDDSAKQQFALELERMIDARRNHPCIVMWVPFNEGWGQHDTPKVVDWIKKHDPTRLVNNASGWTDKGVGDVSDMHNYPGPGMPPTEKNRAAVLGEFGGLGLPLKGHLWVDNKKNWGYRSFNDQAGLFKTYNELIARLRRT